MGVAKIRDSTTVSNTGIPQPISSPLPDWPTFCTDLLPLLTLSPPLLASISKGSCVLLLYMHNRNGLEMCGEAKKPHSLTLNIRFEGWWRGIRSFLSSIDLPELFGKGLLSDFLPDNVRWDGLNFCTVSDLLDSGFGYVSKVVSLLEGWLERGDH